MEILIALALVAVAAGLMTVSRAIHRLARALPGDAEAQDLADLSRKLGRSAKRLQDTIAGQSPPTPKE